MYRAAFIYELSPGDFLWEWRCVKCWNVVDEFASRAVDVDRRSRVKKLRLLSRWKVPLGLCDPRGVLDDYLFDLEIEVKEARR